MNGQLAPRGDTAWTVCSVRVGLCAFSPPGAEVAEVTCALLTGSFRAQFEAKPEVLVDFVDGEHCAAQRSWDSTSRAAVGGALTRSVEEMLATAATNLPLSFDVAAPPPPDGPARWLISLCNEAAARVQQVWHEREGEPATDGQVESGTHVF